MNVDQLSNPIVKAAIEAMNDGNRAAWFALFAPDAVLTDDDSEQDFTQWSDTELFGKDKGRVTAIDKVENNGLMLYAKFHSDKWGNFKTFMRFKVEDGKITRLDVGQA
jgi:ketosteroid isomerase-like protein